MAPAVTNTKVHWHTIEFSHNTRTHNTPTNRKACHAASRNPNTTRPPSANTTQQTQTMEKESHQPSRPPEQQPRGLNDETKHYTPHPHTTNPQHTPQKHTPKATADTTNRAEHATNQKQACPANGLTTMYSARSKDVVHQNRTHPHQASDNTSIQIRPTPPRWTLLKTAHRPTPTDPNPGPSTSST